MDYGRYWITWGSAHRPAQVTSLHNEITMLEQSYRDRADIDIDQAWQLSRINGWMVSICNAVFWTNPARGTNLNGRAALASMSLECSYQVRTESSLIHFSIVGRNQSCEAARCRRGTIGTMMSRSTMPQQRGCRAGNLVNQVRTSGQSPPKPRGLCIKVVDTFRFADDVTYAAPHAVEASGENAIPNSRSSDREHHQEPGR
jgi:hypothetical protein